MHTISFLSLLASLIRKNVLKGPWIQNTCLFCRKDLVFHSALSACPAANYALFNVKFNSSSQNFNSTTASRILQRREWHIQDRYMKQKTVCWPRQPTMLSVVTICLHRWWTILFKDPCPHTFFVCLFWPDLHLAIAAADSNCVMKYWISLDSKGPVGSSGAYASWPGSCQAAQRTRWLGSVGRHSAGRTP